MKYKLRGFLFNKEGDACPFAPGILVSGWEEAHHMLQGLGKIYNYLITLDKIREEEN